MTSPNRYESSSQSLTGRSLAGRSLIAGLLIALSMPPWGWWPLSFVGLVWWVRLERRAVGRRFLVGTLAGLGWFLPSLAWMWFLTAPGFVIAAALFAVLHGLASVVVGRVPTKWRTLASPSAHILVESARLALPFGGVPLATLGIAQVAGPLATTARVGGVIALSWLTWQLSALVALRKDTTAPVRRSLVLVALTFVVLGQWGPSGNDTGRTITIAAVQGGGPQGTRAVDTDSREVVERHLAATRTLDDSEAEPDLVVWPENVVDVADFERSREINEVAQQSSSIGAPFLVGITEDVDSESFTNAQVVVDASATVLDRYDKVRRVPFGEYMPLRGFLKSLGAPVDLVPRDAVAGTGPAVLTIPSDAQQGVTESSQRVAVVISWEVFFGGRAREGVKAGGGFIVNPTNGSSYTWTILQSQQIASSRLRAIETGRWVVQVAPTGFSAFVSPDGNVLDRTAVSEQAVITRSIEIRHGRTIYLRTGDGPWICALALLLVLAAFGDRIRSRSSRSSARR